MQRRECQGVFTVWQLLNNLTNKIPSIAQEKVNSTQEQNTNGVTQKMEVEKSTENQEKKMIHQHRSTSKVELGVGKLQIKKIRPSPYDNGNADKK